MQNIKLDFIHLICLLDDIKHVCKFLAFKYNYFLQKRVYFSAIKTARHLTYGSGAWSRYVIDRTFAMAEGSMHT